MDELFDRVAGRFARVEARRRVRGFLLAQLADLPWKNCWSIAEHAGDTSLTGCSTCSTRASWDTPTQSVMTCATM